MGRGGVGGWLVVRIYVICTVLPQFVYDENKIILSTNIILSSTLFILLSKYFNSYSRNLSTYNMFNSMSSHWVQAELVLTKGRHYYRMLSKVTISRRSWHDFAVTNGRDWVGRCRRRWRTCQQPSDKP